MKRARLQFCPVKQKKGYAVKLKNLDLHFVTELAITIK